MRHLIVTTGPLALSDSNVGTTSSKLVKLPYSVGLCSGFDRVRTVFP